MEQARKRLVELLLEVDYITTHPSWKDEVTVGAVNKNHKYYKYYYFINTYYDGKDGLFRIDYDSIWSVFEKENNMTDQQIEDFVQSTLGERYNFGDITAQELT